MTGVADAPREAHAVGPSAFAESRERPHASNSRREVVHVRVRDHAPVTLLFLERDEGLYVLPSTTDTRWAAAALRDGACEVVRTYGVAQQAAVELVSGPEEIRGVRSAFRSKYGEAAWADHFARSDRVLRLDLRRKASGVGEVQRARSEFDAAAPFYAAAVESNRVQRYLKRRSADRLLATFAGLDPLLEVGPGTGFETLPLLAAGHTIVAVDLSRGMLRELSDRALARGVRGRLTTVESDLGQLGAALADRADGSFAGAFSTFGAPNLASDVSRLGADLGRLVRPGGRAVFTSLNRPGFTSVLWEAIAGDRRGVRARAGRTIPAGVYRFPLDVHLRNPSFWDRALRPWFDRTDTRAVSVLSPPFDSERLDDALGPHGRRRAAAVDATLSRFALLAPLGEWTMITYRRVARGEGA